MTEAEFQQRRMKALAAPKGQKRKRMRALIRLRTRMLRAELRA